MARTALDMLRPATYLLLGQHRGGWSAGSFDYHAALQRRVVLAPRFLRCRRASAG